MTLQNQRTSSNSPVNFDVCLVDEIHENSHLADLESVLSSTLHHLVKFYRNNISFEERRQLTVAPLKGRVDFKTSTVIMEKEEGQINFLELPSTLQLMVFSYLDIRSLCCVSKTCRLLRDLSNDHILWGRILWRDLRKWTLINHQTHPQIYLDAGADLTLKEIYGRCFLGCHHQQGKQPVEEDSLAMRLLKLARPYFYHKHQKRVVMFGPGLESKTSSVVHQLLWGKISPFQVTGLFPGQQDGVGSGVSLKFNEELLNLIILYSSTKREREAAAQGGVAAKNKILLDKDDETEGSLLVEVTHSVRQLCKTIDAFIFIVDSSASKKAVSETNDVLMSMMDERWTNQKAPLLVLSCALSETEPFLSCADVVEALQLCKMNRHWQVGRAVVDSLEGIKTGIDWLLKQCSS